MKTFQFRTASIALALFVSTLSFAQAQTFFGTFSGSNEVPPNASPGTGSASVTLDLALHTLTINVSFTGLIGTTSAAHIHAPAPPGVNASVATTLPSFAGFPLGVTSGTYNMVLNTLDLTTWNTTFVNNFGGGTAAGAETAFANFLNNGQAYFNIHTSAFGGGEIRANLAIPEPSTAVLLGVGMLGGVAVLWRRRRAGA